MILKLAFILGLLASEPVLATSANSTSYASLESQTKKIATTKLEEVLSRYCGEFCQVVGLDVQIDDKVPDGEDMGFEGAVSSAATSQLVVSRITATVQIDDRVGKVNRDRLANILEIHLSSVTLKPEIQWRDVKLPRITRYGEGEPGYIFDSYDDSDYSEGDWNFRPQEYSGAAQKLRTELNQDLTSALNKVIEMYCPSQCILERIEILGGIVSDKAAAKLPRNQQVRDRTGRSIFQIDNIEIDVTFDSSLREEERNRIGAVMSSQVRFASPVNFNFGVLDFPETYSTKMAKQKEDINDPYGLNKLRNMLIMFKELAGTKEIINTETKSVSTDQKETTDSKSKEELSLEEMVLGALAVLAALGLIAFLLLRYNQNRKDAADMMRSIELSNLAKAAEAQKIKDLPQTDGESKEQLSQMMKVQELKDELIEIFIKNPKVAKETFTRILKEDGLEQTAKYVHLFGQLIVFELLKDPNLQRELYELSEYYHNSDFAFSLEEELEMLQKLKTRCTASEIRVRTRKSSEKYEFLGLLDAQQVFNLIQDEKIQVQAIVMTQLERKKRQAVFEMYAGPSKIALMAELSSAEAIPKEYLFNVAKVLSKKVSTKPEFDTENLRTSDILLDLMERAPLAEQRSLMQTLQSKNAETARSIKMKLVTIHVLPYLKDGHLLEIILGMERQDLLIFLNETDSEIRELLLRKAPEELSDSWLEDLESISSSEDATYRLVEMKVLNKVRNLANSGTISLLEINNLLFGDVVASSEFVTTDRTVPELNRSIEAA